MTDGWSLSEELWEGVLNRASLTKLPQHGCTFAGVTIPIVS